MSIHPETITRRQAIQTLTAVGAAFALGSFPLGWARAADGKTQKVLFFTKSSGFQHDAVKRGANGELGFAERTLIELGKQHGFDVTVTKDGSVFTPEKLAEFDLVALYTTGDLDKTDKDISKPSKDGGVPMPPGGFAALLAFVESGKGLVGFHCAADTFNFHMGEYADKNAAHPYTKLIGAEFDGHGKQQKAKITAVGKFAPLKDIADFEMEEEWYRMRNIAPDMHVILVQQTADMEKMYSERKPYPETWARLQGKGRVFYTSMGHREEVWSSDTFHKVVLGGMSWAAGNVQAEVKPNLVEACPGVENVRAE